MQVHKSAITHNNNSYSTTKISGHRHYIQGLKIAAAAVQCSRIYHIEEAL